MGLKILLAGESWTSLGLHLKGFSIYTTGGYEEGGKPLIEALEREGHAVTYIPNHLVPSTFPNTIDGLAGYDVIVLSDIGADTFLLHPDTLAKSLRGAPVSREVASPAATILPSACSMMAFGRS